MAEKLIDRLLNLAKRAKAETDPEKVETIKQSASALMVRGGGVGENYGSEQAPSKGAEQLYFEAKIEDFLRSNNIIFNEASLESELKSDGRFGHLLVGQKTDEQITERFFKFFKPFNFKNKDESEHHRNAFLRELSALDFIKKHTNLPALGVIEDNRSRQVEEPRALIETLPKAPIGFIKNQGEMLKLEPKHAAQIVDSLFALQTASEELPAEIKLNEKIHDAQDPFDSVEGYLENTNKVLSLFEFEEVTEEKYENYVTPADQTEIAEYFAHAHPTEAKQLKRETAAGKVEPGKLPFWSVIEYRLAKQTGRPVDFRVKIQELFTKLQAVLEKYDSEDGQYLVHGDLSPNNVYVAADGQVQFLDWEWAGITKNKALAQVYDVGNMRARAWNNKIFRESLDQAIISGYQSRSEGPVGKAIMAAAILRSHCNLAGFFENYDLAKQKQAEEKARRENTEADIIKAFELMEIEL